MIGIICLWYVGMQLSAPSWYYGILTVNAVIRVISLLMNVYKKGSEAAK